MIVEVTRTSGYGINNSPHPSAVYNTELERWEIDVVSADDLFNLCQDGDELVLSKFEDELEVEIYDDYRE